MVDESRLRCPKCPKSRGRGVPEDRWVPKRRLGSVVCLLAQEKIGLEPTGFWRAGVWLVWLAWFAWIGLGLARRTWVKETRHSLDWGGAGAGSEIVPVCGCTNLLDLTGLNWA